MRRSFRKGREIKIILLLASAAVFVSEEIFWQVFRAEYIRGAVKI